METYSVKIRSIDKITPDVLRIVTSKPDHYNFKHGQATEPAINKPGWAERKKPFSFTCLPEESCLEFTIKTYRSHKGVTIKLLSFKKGDELIIHDVWGAITYTNEGVFITGGAGVTPFISIFRDLKSRNQTRHNSLIFAHKTKADIILENEFKTMLGDTSITILSDEKAQGYPHGFIAEDFRKTTINNFNRQFYVCGPPPMVDMVIKQLGNLGVGKNTITV